MTYQQADVYSRTGDWLVDTARRKPEALLLLAAGCALMMRSGRRHAGSVASRMAASAQTRHEPHPAGGQSVTSTVREGAGRAAETVSRYVGDVADSVGGTAKDYASNVSDSVTEYAGVARRAALDYSEEAQRNISQASERMRERAEATYHTASDTIREQPILVAALGLAAGAAVAALFPATDVERRTLGAASDALAGAAAETGEKLLGAAGAAGERLKETIAERGLGSEGLMDMARDVGGAFTTAATGKAGDDAKARQEPPSTSAGTKRPETRSAADPGPARFPTSAATSRPGPSGNQFQAPGTKATETAIRSTGNVPGRS